MPASPCDSAVYATNRSRLYQWGRNWAAGAHDHTASIAPAAAPATSPVSAPVPSTQAGDRRGAIDPVQITTRGGVGGPPCEFSPLALEAGARRCDRPAMTKRLSLALALALSIGACNKKDANDNATP